jgi:3-methyl-2-oxobutanoate hydroxymethyltransferase
VKPVTVSTLRAMKRDGEKIVSLTAYDYSFASLLDRVGIDVALVGDSVGMVVQGHDTTLPVALDDMIYHSRCVARGLRRALLIVDMPFGTYQEGPEQAIRSCARVMREGLAPVVKIEGGAPIMETVRFLTERAVPVCGHLGLTPQSVHQFGGFRVQARDEAAARQLRDDALSLQQAGASVIVLEAVPAALAGEVSRSLEIPTIGIGAGAECDGQVLVLQDMLGIYPRPSPKFSRNFMEGADSIEAAVRAYAEAVRSGAFPGPEHSFR